MTDYTVKNRIVGYIAIIEVLLVSVLFFVGFKLDAKVKAAEVKAKTTETVCKCHHEVGETK